MAFRFIYLFVFKLLLDFMCSGNKECTSKACLLYDEQSFNIPVLRMNYGPKNIVPFREYFMITCLQSFQGQCTTLETVVWPGCFWGIFNEGTVTVLTFFSRVSYNTVLTADTVVIFKTVDESGDRLDSVVTTTFKTHTHMRWTRCREHGTSS